MEFLLRLNPEIILGGKRVSLATARKARRQGGVKSYSSSMRGLRGMQEDAIGG